ncbi:MAG TPA: MmgE/PrpD family protein, partial [Thermodesulfobacteriota bacterium]|nr:MmgE/PrpD family protein [Thermodesulfobacteriota bacterium]
RARPGARAPMPTCSETLARFVADLTLAQVPPAVVAKAKQILLDTVGIALAASTADSGPMAIALAARLGGRPESQVIGAPVRVAAANAALANGTLAHALDYDDTLEEGVIHAGASAGIAALAVGEAVGASGRAVLEAAIAGLEVAYKLGVVAPGRFHARGFHPSALCAPFGAAAAAGRLYGLSAEELVHAFGVAGSQASGIIEYLADGSWTKQLHPGWGAHAGIVAALLAREGFRGPRTVFEGPHGFFAAFAGGEGVRLARLAEIGVVWELPRAMLKSYPCGSISHPYMDCALRIRQRYAPRPEEIVRVVCRTHPGPVPRLWEPLADKQRPPTPYGAKFSLPYSIAVILVRGRAGLAEFSEAAIRDPEVLGVAAKVGYELDPTLPYPRHFTGHVKVILADGRVLEESQPHPRGGAEAPLPAEELEAKFLANATLAVPRAAAEETARQMGRLEALPGLSALTPLWAPAGG